MFTITELQRAAHNTSKSKGWWDDDLKHLEDPKLSALVIAAKLAVLHREVSEALECVRDRQLTTFYADTGKPEGLPIELADIMIKVGDLAEALGINLEGAIVEKMAYNTKRTHRPGGRAL